MGSTISLGLTKFCDLEYWNTNIALQFLLSPPSRQSRSLTSAQHGSEILLLLEVFRTRIDEEYGLGSFVKWSPWKEMQFIAPISK